MNGGPDCPLCDYERCGGQCAWYIGPGPENPQGGCVVMFILAELRRRRPPAKTKADPGGTPQ